ncbi:hypothetical protein MTBUT4_40058 [Magnetospirillum sp. UT-4]|nr:hypothetical protein MTBUT4_40058 [Magnetospirillum sp. UT-4]
MARAGLEDAAGDVARPEVEAPIGPFLQLRQGLVIQVLVPVIDHEALGRVAGEFLPAPLGHHPGGDRLVVDLGIGIELEDRDLGVVGVEPDKEVDVALDVGHRLLERQADDVIGHGEDAELAAPLEGVPHLLGVGALAQVLEALVRAGLDAERDHAQAAGLGAPQRFAGDHVDAAAEIPGDPQAPAVQLVAEGDDLLVVDVEQVVVEAEFLVAHGQALLDLVADGGRAALAVALDRHVAEGAAVRAAARRDDGGEVVAGADDVVIFVLADVLAVHHRQRVDVVHIGGGHRDAGQEPLVGGRIGQERLDGVAGVDTADMGEIRALLQALHQFGEHDLALADDDAVEQGKLGRLLGVGDGMVAAQAQVNGRVHLAAHPGDLHHIDQADGEGGDADHIGAHLLDVTAKFRIACAFGDAVLEIELMALGVLFQIGQNVERAKWRERSEGVRFKELLTLLVGIFNNRIFGRGIDDKNAHVLLWASTRCNAH